MGDVALPAGLAEHLAVLPVREHLSTWECGRGRCRVCRENDEATAAATLDFLRERGWTIEPPPVEEPTPAVVPSGPRPSTPDAINQATGSRRVTVKRSCNGCDRDLGDATADELRAAMSGRALPDVRVECGCQLVPGR